MSMELQSKVWKSVSESIIRVINADDESRGSIRYDVPCVRSLPEYRAENEHAHGN